ncbi:MAG TPA: membrane dipeptidase [Anaerolineae bacterium]
MAKDPSSPTDQTRTDWFIVDGHVDLAYNALGWRRNYRHAARWTRGQEKGTAALHNTGQCMVGLPDLIRGHVGVVFGTIFLEPASRQMGDSPLVYRSAQEAHTLGMAQLDFYHRWADHDAHVRVIESQSDLTSVLSAWRLTADSTGKLACVTPSTLLEPAGHQVGIVPLMEGADPILEPKELERWVEHGLRIIGPAWAGTRYAGGTGEPGGFTRQGRELLEMIAGLHLILDVSHLAQQALFEALEDFEGAPGTLIASHSNPQRIMPSERHLPDPAIELIAERKGVIGVVLYNAFLKRGWGRGSSKHEVTLDDVVRAIDHICQVTGSADHVAIGSDFDGGFGSESAPRELDTSRDLYRIGAEMLRRGYNRDDVEKVMGGNWLRILKNALP